MCINVSLVVEHAVMILWDGKDPKDFIKPRGKLVVAVMCKGLCDRIVSTTVRNTEELRKIKGKYLSKEHGFVHLYLVDEDLPKLASPRFPSRGEYLRWVNERVKHFTAFQDLDLGIFGGMSKEEREEFSTPLLA
jgi:hypothetical protein